MRGGKREGSGRPSRKLPITKITVYTEIRDKLNEHAQNANMPVVELMYRIVHHNSFDDILWDIISDDWKQDLKKETDVKDSIL